MLQKITETSGIFKIWLHIRGNTCTLKYWYCISDECEGLTVRMKKPSRSVKDVKSMVTSHPAARSIHLIRRLRRKHVRSSVTKLSNARGYFSGTLRASSFTLNRVRKNIRNQTKRFLFRMVCCDEFSLRSDTGVWPALADPSPTWWNASIHARSPTRRSVLTGI